MASITFKADQVVSGVAINFLALGLSVYFVKYLYDGAGKTPTVRKSYTRFRFPVERNPRDRAGLVQRFPTTIWRYLVVIVTYIVLYHTSFGMRLRQWVNTPTPRRRRESMYSGCVISL